uniref:Uncharacterized protein LOC108039085 n=1 Tax=Drosophila rhopaloa TaxID=1041015 RepID=A0A6P4E4Y4_DRORH
VHPTLLKNIDGVVQLFQQREQLYAACWTHNEWIPQVPEITDESLNVAIEVVERVLDKISLKSLCGVESRDEGSPAEIVSIASTVDIVEEEPSCPPTQFNITNFMDIENLSLFSQATQTAADPPMSAKHHRARNSNGVPSKRIRLVNDNGPQLRQQFPQLPMGECGANQPPDPVDNITPSLDFSAVNTLLESSNLNALLDSTNVNTRKVIGSCFKAR